MLPDDDPIREMLRHRIRRGDEAAYEALYAEAQADPAKIPWADLAPNPNVTEWFDRQRIRGGGRAALVVGCGLGDDAEELARKGFKVTAFDLSATAIAWCRRRFADSSVQYVVASLLEPPRQWREAFDFVLEAYTVQAVSLAARQRALANLPRFIAPGGTLLIVCRARDESDDPGSLPYPLTRHELESVATDGLTQIGVDDYLDHSRNPPVRRFRAWYRRPPAVIC